MNSLDTLKVIVLVHGTFANQAPWIKENSIFVNGLKSRLGVNSKIIPFNWSGKNSYLGRVNAGEDLALVLNQISNDYPLAEKIVIGHSHGGNVIFYALRADPMLVEKYKVVTLATPFLISSLKDNEETKSVISIFKTSVIPYALFGLSSIVLIMITILTVFTYYELFKPLLLLGLLPFTIIPLLYEYFIENGPHKDFYYEKAISIFKKIDISINTKVQVLSICYRNDEAKNLLKISESITAITTDIFDSLNLVVKKTARILGIIFGISLMLFVLTAFISDYLNKNINDWISNVMTQISLICILFWFYYSKLFSYVTYIYYLFSANPLFYGWKKWSHFLYIKTDVSTYPSHIQDPVYIELVIQKTSLFELRHTQIHENAHVLDIISQWVKGYFNYSMTIKLKQK